MTPEEGYKEFRGRCHEMALAAAKADPSLTVVRGHYWCPLWNAEEPHWWCVDDTGDIVDPTREQFPSAGMGTYTPWDGYCSCEECGKDIVEDDAVQCGRYAVCSTACALRLVGL